MCEIFTVLIFLHIIKIKLHYQAFLLPKNSKYIPPKKVNFFWIFFQVSI